MFFEQFKGVISGFGAINTVGATVEIGLTILAGFLLGLLISYTYKITYKGFAFSEEFAHTLIIVCIIISLIISVIGTNIARAFSLAGALSIIRFRSAVQAPKDIAFIFFAMGAGLACGAGLFIPAALFVVVVCLIIILLKTSNFARPVSEAKVLRITLPESLNYDGLFDGVLKEFTDNFELQSIRTINAGSAFELVYHIRMRNDVSEKMMIDEIRIRNANFNVFLMRNLQDNA